MSSRIDFEKVLPRETNAGQVFIISCKLGSLEVRCRR